MAQWASETTPTGASREHTIDHQPTRRDRDGARRTSPPAQACLSPASTATRPTGSSRPAGPISPPCSSPCRSSPSVCGPLDADPRPAELAVFAGLLYVVYNYGIFVFSVVMNPLTAVHIAIVGLALWSLVLVTRGASLSEAGAAVAEDLSRRASGVLLIAVAGLFSLLWIGQIATATTTGVLAPDLVQGRPLDQSGLRPRPCVLPAAVRGGRHRAAPTDRWPRAYGQPMLIWVALMGAGVVGGFLFSAAAGEEVPVAVALVIGALSLASAALAAVADRPPCLRSTNGPCASSGASGEVTNVCHGTTRYICGGGVESDQGLCGRGRRGRQPVPRWRVRDP